MDGDEAAERILKSEAGMARMGDLDQKIVTGLTATNPPTKHTENSRKQTPNLLSLKGAFDYTTYKYLVLWLRKSFHYRAAFLNDVQKRREIGGVSAPPGPAPDSNDRL